MIDAVPKVLLVSDNWLPSVGGLESHIRTLTESLSRDIDIQVLTHERHSSQHPDGFTRVRTFPGLLSDCYYAGVKEFMRLERTKGPFVVHLSAFSFAWPNEQMDLVRFVVQELCCPVLLKVPTSGMATEYLPRFRQVLPLISGFIALTNSIADELQSGGIPHHRIFRIPNPVDDSRFEQQEDGDRERLRASEGFAQSDVVALFAGRLTAQKALGVLVSSYGSMLGTDHRLIVVGAPDGVYGRAFIPTQHEYPNVTYAGPIGDPRSWYAIADLYVSNSRAEGMSNSCLEAMSCGLPLLVSDIPGHRELVRRGENGWLVEFDEPSEWNAAIRSLPGRLELRRMGGTSRDVVKAQFAAKTIAMDYRSLYRRLLRGSE